MYFSSFPPPGHGHPHTPADQQSLGVGSPTPSCIRGQRVCSMNLWRPSHHAARADWMLVAFPFECKEMHQLFCHLANKWLRLERRRQRAWRSEELADNPTCRPNRNHVRGCPSPCSSLNSRSPWSLPVQRPPSSTRTSTLLSYQKHRLGCAYAPDVKRMCAVRLLAWVHDGLGQMCDRKLVAPLRLKPHSVFRFGNNGSTAKKGGCDVAASRTATIARATK